jgi:ATP-dependent exoDNAse (exonuclease V) beta subunit
MELLTKIQQPFSKLSFEEKRHRYYVESEPIKTSVSGLISKFYEHFNAEEVAPYSAAKAGVTTEEILAQWAAINQESRDRGHRVHNFGELYQFNRSLKPSCPQEEAIVKFWQDVPEHILPLAAELRMYHFKHLFAGTADIILFDTKTQTYIIADYKTNKDLFKNYKSKTMIGAFSHLLDMPLNHYVIQLSYYQLLLEQVGVKVSKRVIIWLGLDGNYQLFETEDVTGILKSTLNS